MAVFVLKAMFGSTYNPPGATGVFADVPVSDPFAGWIEDLYNRGVVAGCGPGPTFCPDNPVNRQQMSVFLLKTLLGSGYVPPACKGVFADVPCSNAFAPWIEALYSRHIAAGCGGNNFCPTNPTTRGQMAPFLSNTFDLKLYGP
jgi:S-layer homology domain